MKTSMLHHEGQIFITYSFESGKVMITEDVTFEVPTSTTVSYVLDIGQLLANAKSQNDIDDFINYKVPSTWKFIG